MKFQYQAKHLFVLVLVCSVVIAKYSAYVRERRETMAWVTAQEEIQKRLGIQFGALFKHKSTDLLVLSIHDQPVAPATLAVLSGLTIEDLDLAATDVRDADLAVLTKIKGLRALCLAETSITNRSLTTICKLPNLEKLDISGTSMTDAGVEELKKLRNLKELYIGRSQISVFGLVQLEDALPNCKVVATGRY